MPIASIKVIKDVFTDEEKQELIERVSEAIVSVEGEGIREKTIVIVEEANSGDWGIGGQLLTAEAVRELRKVR